LSRALRRSRFDVAVIGAGVLGTAIAARLAETSARVCVLEAADDVAEGASKGNAGITSSYYAAPGTLEAELISATTPRWEEVCARLDVPYRRIGAVMAALSPEELDGLPQERANALGCGVRAELVTADEARRLEPLISPECLGALVLPDEGIIDPMRLCVGFAELAARNGTAFRFSSPVTGAETHGGRVTALVTPTERIEVDFVVNAAGVFADLVSLLAGGESIQVWPRKGEYWLIDREWGSRLQHIVFAAPLPDTKGIHVVPTTNGTVLLGPSVEDGEDRFDKATDAETLASVASRATRLVPTVPLDRAIKAFAAIRPATEPRVRLERDPAVGNLVHAINRSTGVSSSLATADRVVALLGEAGLDLAPNPAWVGSIPRVRRLLTDPEPETLTTVDPRYAQVVCVCEQVSAAEIAAAFGGHVPAPSIDGIRKRTRATGGRCQGSVCLAGVTFMCSLALGLEPGRVVMTAGGELGVP
jgi:glycerol-3-phosphate dehydrogenase